MTNTSLFTPSRLSAPLLFAPTWIGSCFAFGRRGCGTCAASHSERPLQGGRPVAAWRVRGAGKRGRRGTAGWHRSARRLAAKCVCDADGCVSAAAGLGAGHSIPGQKRASLLSNRQQTTRTARLGRAGPRIRQWRASVRGGRCQLAEILARSRTSVDVTAASEARGVEVTTGGARLEGRERV